MRNTGGKKRVYPTSLIQPCSFNLSFSVGGEKNTFQFRRKFKMFGITFNKQSVKSLLLITHTHTPFFPIFRRATCAKNKLSIIITIIERDESQQTRQERSCQVVLNRSAADSWSNFIVLRLRVYGTRENKD